MREAYEEEKRQHELSVKSLRYSLDQREAQTGATWVDCNERLPPNDMLDDYPKEYCLKCMGDGRRGAPIYEQGNLEAIEHMLKTSGYDVINWLDETGTIDRNHHKEAITHLEADLAEAREYIRRLREGSTLGWVKASEFKTHKPIYRPYRKPAMEDEGEYDYGEIYVTEDDGRIYLDVDNECNYEHQSDERWADYEILDESEGESDAVELLRWLNENDWNGVGSGEYINSTTGRILKEEKLYKEFKRREK